MPLFVVIFPQVDEAAQNFAQENMQQLMEFQENLAKAGKLIWSERLYPDSKDAARVITDANGNQTVQNGPFGGQTLGGYTIINVADLDEAVKLVQSFPIKRPGHGVEIRRSIELKDMPLPEEIKAKALELRALMAKNAQALA